MRVAIGGDSKLDAAVPVDQVESLISACSPIPSPMLSICLSNNTGDGNYDGDVASHESGHGFGLYASEHLRSKWRQNQRIQSRDGHLGADHGRSLYATDYLVQRHRIATVPPSYQDDMAVLAGSVNGFGYRADDHGDTIATPVALTFDGQTWSGFGAHRDQHRQRRVVVLDFDGRTRTDWRSIPHPLARTSTPSWSCATPPARFSLRRIRPLVWRPNWCWLLRRPPTSYRSAKMAAYGFVGAYTVSVTRRRRA